MSDIVEYVLPKCEYNDDDDYVAGDDDAGSDRNNHCFVVVLDTEDNVMSTSLEDLQQNHNQEYFIINENIIDGESLVNEADLQQPLAVADELQHAIHRVPKEEYFLEEQHIQNIDNLVEEDFEDADEEHHKYIYSSSPTPAIEAPLSPLLPPASQSKALMPQVKNSFQNITRAQLQQHYDNEYAAMHHSDNEPVDDVKPSDKMLNEFKGPRRYLLFDELVATIVDFDEANTPIVEFSLISSAQDEKLPVECGICPDVMHKAKLSKHQKTHLVPGSNRYACIYCAETYRDCKYLAGHARRHMGIRPYVCEMCKLYFSTKQDLRVHNQRRHQKREHICEMCGKTFAQNTQLKRHREATHEKKRRFPCLICQKAYYKNFSLQEHVRNVHKGERRMLTCPFCSMQCRDAHKMARHRKEMHLNQDSYVCYLCKEEFTDINYFDAHKRSIQCRSNTERLMRKDQLEKLDDALDGLQEEQDNVDDMFEDEYDEDAGLLVEADANNDNDEEEHTDIDNTDYLHNADQAHLQFVEVNQHERYDECFLIENAAVEENESLLDEDQYIEAIEMQHNIHPQHYEQQQQQPQNSQEFNDDLIYEITLETEDN